MPGRENLASSRPRELVQRGIAVKSDRFVPEARCLLCGAPGRLPLTPFGTRWDGRQFDYLDCTACWSRFMHPVPSSQDFERIYTRCGYHEVHYRELASGQFSRSLRMLAKFAAPGTRLLDFGCGNGEFLKEATAAGYVAEGVELDVETCRSAAANSGCPVTSLSQARRNMGRYDAIHLGDVLEHLPDPAGTMHDLEALLTSTGLFLVEGPLEENRSLVAFTAAVVRRLKAATRRPNYAHEPPTHLTRTSARSQRRFFEESAGYRLCNFEVYESGWPYAAPWRDIFPPKSGSIAIRGLIAKAATGIARASNIASLAVGDRFIAVLRPIRSE
jgi:2-polyprenyl-3-methyl-5-hydroxy-6-metoxy-1,4-benzoquinol methylase